MVQTATQTREATRAARSTLSPRTFRWLSRGTMPLRSWPPSATSRRMSDPQEFAEKLHAVLREAGH